MKRETQVYLLGAGPGDPDLLTVRAAKLLKEADVIIHDRLIPPLNLLQINPLAKLIDVGKEAKTHRRSQGEINEIILQEAKSHKKIVRLKGGDSFVFGRGGEEAELLFKAGIDYEVVPGISSAIAVPAYAGIPVTHRGVATEFAVVTGHEDPKKKSSSIDWKHLARGVGTCVFLMGVKNLKKIVSKLIENGRDPATPAAIIHRGCSGAQRVLEAPLEDLPDAKGIQEFVAPSITIVGEVVKLREKLGAWFERLPLFGRCFVSTRPLERGGRKLALSLMRLGARVINSPLISIEKRDPVEGMDEALGRLGSRGFSWIIFTSANGVEIFFQELYSRGLDVRVFGKSKIATIGPATAKALKQYGLVSDLTPKSYTAEGLLELLPSSFNVAGEVAGGAAGEVVGSAAGEVAGGIGEELGKEEKTRGPRVGRCEAGKQEARASILLPRAEGARPKLVEELKARGADVVELKTYRSRAAQHLSQDFEREADSVDALILFSPSAAEAYARLTEENPKARLGVIAIGPITGGRARELGLEVLAQAKEHSLDGVLEILMDYYCY